MFIETGHIKRIQDIEVIMKLPKQSFTFPLEGGTPIFPGVRDSYSLMLVGL